MLGGALIMVVFDWQIGAYGYELVVGRVMAKAPLIL
jgi:hypothetical protein